MNYYDELLDKINSLIQKEHYSEAEKLIEDELSVAYIPRDVEEKLHSFKQTVQQNVIFNNSLNDDQIENYLFLDESHQLLAINELNKRNLRNYKDLCNRYLKSDGYKNAKVLLIDSLIRQEINDDFSYIDEEMILDFNPSLLLPVEKTDGFIRAISELQEIYLKEPSMYQMAIDLLYKECLLSLPVLFNEEEGKQLALKISDFIRNAFDFDK